VGEDGGFATFTAPIRSLNVTLFAFLILIIYEIIYKPHFVF
jgi:hypothetical protein